MSSESSARFISLDHDKFISAHNMGNSPLSVVIWATELGSAAFLRQARDVLGSRIEEGEGVVLLSRLHEDENAPRELSVDDEGNAGYIGYAVLEVSDADEGAEEPDEDADYGYGPGYGDGLGEGAASEVLAVVEQIPDRINCFHVWSERQRVAWRAPSRLYTSFSVAHGALVLGEANRTAYDDLIARSAIGGLAVYSAILDEFATTIPALQRA